MHRKIILCLAIAAVMLIASGCSSPVKTQPVDTTIDTSLPNSLTITDKPVPPRAPAPAPTPAPVAPAAVATSAPATTVTSSAPVNLPPVVPTPNPTSVPPVPMAGQAISISIKDFSFNPAEITVSAGAIVTWTNNDALSHDIISASFKSPLLSQGQTFSQKFTTAGTFNYSCGIHPSMKGKIIVN
jgi:plastocyanin